MNRSCCLVCSLFFLYPTDDVVKLPITFRCIVSSRLALYSVINVIVCVHLLIPTVSLLLCQHATNFCYYQSTDLKDGLYVA